MKKKGLSLFLALAMCLTLLPSIAFAVDEDSIHEHYLCGGDSCTENGHTETEKTNFTKWIKTDSLPDTAGTYYLNHDVTLTETWVPANGTTLCLNGHKIQANGNFDAITIGDGVTFTLTECSDEQGKITHASGSGRGVLVEGTAVFNMYGGDITGNSSEKEGAGVNTLGTFNMYGGSITKNTMTATSNYSGGGVCVGSTYSSGSEVRSKTFNMYDGLIAENKSNNGGGGVNLGSYATFFMHNGSIANNQSSSGGGGVSAGSDKFTMTGGSITGNICGAKYNGGGVSVYSKDPTFTVSGEVTISGNKRGTENNNVFLHDSMSYSGNYFSILGIGEAGLKSTSQIGITTEVEPLNTKNLPIAAKNDTDYSENFFSDAGYQVVYNTSTKQLELSQTQSVHAHPACGQKCTHNGTHRTISASDWTPINSENELQAINAAGNYYLTDNVIISATWEPVDGVVLCLNGHNITMQNPDITDSDGNPKNADVDVIKVSGHFILTDCKTGDAQGEITHATDSSNEKYNGRGVYVSGGTFDMYGGRITGNTSTYDIGGSGVSVRGVSDTTKVTRFNLYGGEITENTAKSGGGVHVSRQVSYGSSEFYMYGGSITNNVADSDIGSYGIGGGVYVSWTSKFVMCGGEISGNIANQSGGGVYASALARESEYTTGGAATLEISGAAKITRNTVNKETNNLCLDSSTAESNFETVSAKIAITDTLTDEIGVTTTNVPETGNPIIIATGATSGTDYSNNIKSDNANYEVQHRGNTLVLAVPGDEPQPSDHTHNWTYAEKVDANDTIVAQCNVDGCTAPDGGWIKINAPENLIYNGQSKAAILTKSDNWQGVDVDQIKIQYQTRFEDGTGSQLYDTLSTEPGTYRAWIELPTDVWAYTEYTIVKNDSGNNSSSSSGSSHTSNNSYTVSTSTSNNGTITSNVKTARKGSTVTITVQPDSGYKLDKLTVVDIKNNAVALIDKGNGTYIFTMPDSEVEIMPSFVKDTATEPEMDRFMDVNSEDYFFEAVKWAAEKGITGGIGKNLFGPSGPCTRAQIVTFLWRAAGSPDTELNNNFSDVSANAYYAEAVAWAIENGITTGISGDKFSPDMTCTRAQAVTFLCRFAKAQTSGGASDFRDVAANAYYAAAVKWATENNITNGIGSGLFGSNDDCTRAQIVTFLWRLNTKN